MCFRGDAKLVALGVLHNGPTVETPISSAHDSCSEIYQIFNRCKVRIHQVEVYAVLRTFYLFNFVEIPGGFTPFDIRASDGRENVTTSIINGATQHGRPEFGDLQNVVATESDVRDPKVDDIPLCGGDGGSL